MVFRKFREQYHINKHLKPPLNTLEEQLSFLKGREPIAICPKPMGNSWQGIATATEGLFTDRIFYLPQYFSNTVYSKEELNILSKLLIQTTSEHIVFSGYLPYFDQLILPLSRSGKKVSVIYHGSHTSILEDPNAALHFKSLIELSKQKVLYKLGFVKKDMDKTFHLLTGQDFYPILLKTDKKLFSLIPNSYEGLNIGVLTHDMFRKNLYNMVSAALLNPIATVHMKEKYLTDYLGKSERIQTHGMLKEQLDFLKIMGGMTINYYVTFSECWGQYVNESLAMGVPCLTSDVSAVLDFDPEIKNLLTVKEFDNDFAIYKKSIEVLENRQLFKSKGPAYILKLNEIADQTLNNFVS